MARESNEHLADRIFDIRGTLADVPVYAWDLDSTVCSTMNRRYLVEQIREGKATWDDYAMECSGDTPIVSSVALMRELKGSHIAISGRSGKAEGLTYAWFVKYKVPIDAVLLRVEGDHSKNGDYKVRVLQALQRSGADIRLFFEDWDEVAKKVFAETGIHVVCINPVDGSKEWGPAQPEGWREGGL